MKKIGCHKYHSWYSVLFYVWYEDTIISNSIILFSYTHTQQQQPKCCLKKKYYVYNFTIYDVTIAVILNYHCFCTLVTVL